MKRKICLAIAMISVLSMSAFAGQYTKVCVKAAGYYAPFWGSTTYKLQIHDGSNLWEYTGTTTEQRENMKIWLSIALAAKVSGKQIGIYHDDNVFNIFEVGIEDTNCP